MSNSNHDPVLSANPRPHRVLFVDDNAAVRTTLGRYLELHGFEVDGHGNGTSAIQRLEHDPPPDFILTDYLLPDLDGLEIARASRRMSSPPRVLLLTGWPVQLPTEEAARLGVVGILAKPVRPDELLAALRTAGQVPPPGADGGPAGRA